MPWHTLNPTGICGIGTGKSILRKNRNTNIFLSASSGVNSGRSKENILRTGAKNLSFNEKNSPLPVTLLSFEAALTGKNMVQCSWITASEINNDYFSLERSRNGSVFETIATIDGAGNSSTLLSYYFTDEHPCRGMSYYCIKQTDFDGRSAYSETRVISISVKGMLYFAYPNPASSFVNLMVSGEKETAGAIRITVAPGRTVHEQSFVFKAGEQRIQIGISAVPSGNYLLQVFTTDQVVQQKISILH